MVVSKKIHYCYKNLLAYCFFLTMAISVWAVRTPNSTLGTETLRLALKIIFYLLIVIEFALTFLPQRRYKTTAVTILIAVWPVIYWGYIHAWAFRIESLALTSPVIAFLFALQNDKVKKTVFLLFKKFLVFVSFIGIICYFTYILKLSIPYSIEPYYDGRPYQNYVNYFNISFLYISGTNIRICGIFNEPGWFGTTIGLILCFEKLDLKKISNWVLIIAGLLTYSLAFVIIMAVGFVLRNIENIRKWILIAALLCFAIFALPSIHTNNEQINHLIARLEITSKGLSGNNRSSSTVNNLLKETLTSYKCMFGYGDGYAEYINGENETKQILTIKTELINFGIIGTFILYIVPLFFFLYSAHCNKESLLFLICFWISLYQRPWLYIVSNYMILLSTVSYINTDDKPVPERHNTHLRLDAAVDSVRIETKKALS